jgi:hypothetical protein
VRFDDGDHLSVPLADKNAAGPWMVAVFDFLDVNEVMMGVAMP